MGYWLFGSDELLERYVAEDPLDMQIIMKSAKEPNLCSLFPVYHGVQRQFGTKQSEAITETHYKKQTIFSLNYVDMFLRLSIQTGKNGLHIYAPCHGCSIYGDEAAAVKKIRNYRNVYSVKW